MSSVSFQGPLFFLWKFYTRITFFVLILTKIRRKKLQLAVRTHPESSKNIWGNNFHVWNYLNFEIKSAETNSFETGCSTLSKQNRIKLYKTSKLFRA